MKEQGSSPGDVRTPIVAWPQIVGVVNVTDDSFSDGGLYFQSDAAIAHAQQLRADGADLIELGPASSHPDAKAVSADEERRRLEPVLDRLQQLDIPVSVDSFLPQTQRFALGRGVACVNDIQGFPDPDLYQELAESKCQLVVMHSIQGRGKATRVDIDSESVWASIIEFFTARLADLKHAGVVSERIIIDPGLGFFLSSDPSPSVNVLRRVQDLRTRFGHAVLVSPSRKSFLQRITGRTASDVGAATLAAELYVALRGVDYIRTHNVRALQDALTVFRALSDTISAPDRLMF